MHRGGTDHGGSVSSAGPGWRTGDAALRVGAILPQHLESTVLQDVDVTDLQPGLGRDLVNGPTLDNPAVDDVRLALVELRPACRTTSRLDSSANHTRQFSLDVRGAWRDNGPVLPVAACNPHNGDCLKRQTDDALLLPGLVQLEISPPTTRGTLWRLPPRPTLGRHPWCVG
jgi:hypothetical protein